LLTPRSVWRWNELGKRVLVLGNNNFRFHQMDMFAPILSGLMEKAGFQVTLTQDLNDLAKERIGAFDIFLCYYTGGKLTREQLQGLMSFVSSGGGFIGLHSAADSFRENPGYLELLGGVFRRHPRHQVFHIRVADREHPITRGIPDFDVYDELYILYHDPKRYHLLLYCPWEGEEQPVAWTKEYGGGRVFYLSLGHTEEALTHPTFQEILRRGLRWVSP